ncbi:MlaD family protein [Sphingosinicella humi]|uniref:MCE family protein n=1 Tax=Allosphingosinicella humi TaxID=2068657 RepID=A0A2U2J1N1_9SPHN|nr:MlaD family protein [Sphingosinicella humi]PWG02248.1 MCE family protein [Sphingosinicella humi]
MENRSNHILVGGVVLALIVALLGFIIWLTQVSGEDNKEYDIFFKQGVDGLARGSGVSFNGVPVGQVASINLDRTNPEFVRVRIAVREDTPILEGTTATVEGVGFTGVSQIQLDPAPAGAPPIQGEGPYGVPVIPTKPGALGQLLNSAPELLQRVTTLTERLTELLADRNQESIAAILDNMEEISGSLAERGPEIAATLAEARVAIRQAGAAAEEFGKLASTTDRLLSDDAQPLINDLQQTVQAAEQSMKNLDAVLSDARPGVQAFSNQTLPEIGQLVRDLRATSEALRSVTRKVDRQGAGSIIGGQELPDYEPR